MLLCNNIKTNRHTDPSRSLERYHLHLPPSSNTDSKQFIAATEQRPSVKRCRSAATGTTAAAHQYHHRIYIIIEVLVVAGTAVYTADRPSALQASSEEFHG